jgi:hypothetical protein
MNAIYVKKLTYLIRVSQTAHTRHYTQNVIVRGEYFNATTSRDTSQGHLELSVINAREVARARRLVLLRL